MKAFETALTQQLGCRYPVIQTAMGWVSSPDLVVATSEAGGFGFLAGAVMTPQEVDAGIQEIKSRTDKLFGVNFHMFQPGAKEIVENILSHSDRVRAISYGRGPDGATVQRFKDAGVLCIPTVGAVRHAVKAVRQGADMVVIQGGEGGGHTGAVPTTLLLPQVLDAVEVPVIAAGGFRDGRGLAAALAFGAAGIAMGTRFLLTQESPVPLQTKERYLAASVDEIPVSRQVDGMPQRMVMNRVLADLDGASKAGLLLRGIRNGLAFKKMTNASLMTMLKSAWNMAKKTDMTMGQVMMSGSAPVLIQKAMVQGHPDEGVLPSGQVAGLIEDIPTVAELIDGIVREAEQRIASLCGGKEGQGHAD
ncbi:nitronate monooxygenase [Emcibacter sp.]|uniref:NAD(P)H-dependent flavin oxidoreductase n=1 Tax=Emcibacter sp. TaxID=1979954 RepID=UPI002AA61EEB|nr:nitronate monooxygenase [Emcibacter sp.]